MPNSLRLAPLVGASILSFAHTQQWTQVAPSASPNARNSHGLSYDVARGVAVMFGGYDGNNTTALGDTWAFDGANWTPRTPATAPDARWGHAMAFDNRRARTVLFGGFRPGVGSVADTWEFDGSNWTQLTPTHAPAGRAYHAMAFDSARNRMVAFGGLGNALATLGDTWAFDGVDWTQVATANAPSARRGAAIAFDAARGRTVLFGGGNGTTNFNDTWTFDGTSWTQRTTTAAPGARWQAAATFDSVRGRVVLHGGADVAYATNYGDTWEWDDTNWAQTSTGGPSTRHGAGMAYDGRRGAAVLFGGRGAGFVGDTWEAWSSNGPGTWGSANANFPGIRVNYPLSTDTTRNRVLLFGGIENSATWEWNGTAWLNVTPAGAPAWRHGPAIAYDPIRQEHVMYGGGQYSNILGETWIWNGATWSRRFPAQSPSARREHVMAFDTVRNRIVLYGGFNNTTVFSDMWEWDGSTWTQIPLVATPGPWSNRNSAYDSARREWVLYGAGTTRDETWIWDGLSWRKHTGAVNPGRRDSAGMSYHPPTGLIVLSSGEICCSGNFLGDTWLWDGAGWRQDNPSAAPCNSPPYAGAYDPVNQKSLILAAHPWNICGTWLYSPPTTSPTPTATFTTYGTSCNTTFGAPQLTTAPNSTPRLGQTLQLRFSNLPTNSSQLPFGFFATRNDAAIGLPLPFSMARYGMNADCLQYVDPDSGLVFTLVNNAGSADWDLAIPNDPALLQLAVFFQGLVLDWNLTTPLPAASTNAGVATIGR